MIFSSDNGGVNHPERDDAQGAAVKAGLAPTGPFKGGKHDVWEGGFRVPLLVRWPGKVPAGTVCDDMVSLTDLLATVVAAVGVPQPPANVGAEDSFSFLPALLNQPHEPARSSMIDHSADGVFAVRRGPWKYVEGKPADGVKAAALKARRLQMKPQLYHLVDDPAETRDVSTANPEVVKELAGLLDQARAAGRTRP